MRLPVQAGSVVANKYRVSRVLGEGGMGWVVGAEHLQMPTTVAIKFLKQQASAEHLERFRREAKSLAQLHTEHVARVLDVGTLASGEPYIVMEYLDGLDLAQLAKQNGRLSIAQVADYMCQACVALSEAHALGIIHRDVKPANLFLANLRDGRQIVKVVDFGISKVNAAARGPKTGLTETGAFLGSPAFVSPEQLRSTRQVDARSDVWSLGASIYKLIAGRDVFEANSVAELAMAILVAPPPPLRAVVPEAPVEVEQIILRCLSREPEARFQSVAELAAALMPFGGPAAQAAVAQIQGNPVSAASLPAASPPAAAAVQIPAAVPPAVQVPEAVAPAGPSRRLIVGGIALGGALLSGGVAAWIIVGAEGDGSTDREPTAKKRKSKSKKKPKDSDDEASDDDLPSASIKLPKGKAFFGVAKEIGDAVGKAHDGPLRVYDALFFKERARFVVGAKKSGSLVRYEAEGSRLVGPVPHELARTSRLDSLLIDVDKLRLRNVEKMARDAPRRLGKPSAEPYSVSLHRLSTGVIWSVALESGETARFALDGSSVE